MIRRGFSLVEITVVLVVLSVGLFLVFPAWQSFSAQISLQTSAQLLVSELHRLQSSAELEHKTVTLDPTKLNLSAGLTLSGKTDLSFSASGFPPPGGSGTLIVSNRFGQQKKIVVSSVGRIRLE